MQIDIKYDLKKTYWVMAENDPGYGMAVPAKIKSIQVQLDVVERVIDYSLERCITEDTLTITMELLVNKKFYQGKTELTFIHRNIWHL
jgi:hypothetical protein